MTSQWKRLTDKAAAVQGRSILDLFDDGRAGAFSARLDAFEGILEMLTKQHPVGQVGEHVMAGQMRDLGLGAAALGDVFVHGDPAAVAAAVRASRHRVGPAGAEPRLLFAVHGVQRGEGAHQVEHRLQQVGVDHLADPGCRGRDESAGHPEGQEHPPAAEIADEIDRRCRLAAVPRQ